MKTYKHLPKQRKQAESQAASAGANSKSKPSKEFSGEKAEQAAIQGKFKVQEAIQMAFDKATVHTKTDLLYNESGEAKKKSSGVFSFAKPQQSDILPETDLNVDFDSKDNSGAYVKAKDPVDDSNADGFIPLNTVFKADAFDTDTLGNVGEATDVITGGLDVVDIQAGGIERQELKEVTGGKLQDKANKDAGVEGSKNRMDVAAGVGGTIGGLIGMAASVKSFREADDEWSKFEAGMELAENTAGTASGINKIIDAAAKSGGSEDGVGKSDVSGKVLDSIGAAISSVKNAVLGLHGIYKIVAGKSENKGEDGLKAAKQLVSAAQSAAVVAKQAYDIIGNGIPTSVLTTIPALGIAISGIDIIIRFNDRMKASGVREEIGGNAFALRRGVTLDLGGTAADIFHEDKRGKWPHYETFQRINKDIITTVDEAHNEGIKAKGAGRSAKEAVHTKIDASGVAPAVKAALKTKMANDNSLDSFYELRSSLHEYELADKLDEIAMKRKTSASNDIAADLVNIAADIVTLSGVGAIAGAVMKGVVVGGKMAHAGAIGIQKIQRRGGDRSQEAKHAEYVKHTRFIFQMTNGLEDRTTVSTDPTKLAHAKKVAGYVKATGVNSTLLYAENGNPAKQANMIVESLKKRK